MTDYTEALLIGWALQLSAGRIALPIAVEELRELAGGRRRALRAAVRHYTRLVATGGDGSSVRALSLLRLALRPGSREDDPDVRVLQHEVRDERRKALAQRRAQAASSSRSREGSRPAPASLVP